MRVLATLKRFHMNQKGQSIAEGILDIALAGSIGLFVAFQLWNALYTSNSDLISNSGANNVISQTIFDMIPFMLIAIVLFGVLAVIMRIRRGRPQQESY